MSNQKASFSEGFEPRFLLTVDTEEEFDWGAEFQRQGHGLEHVENLATFQNFCEDESVIPLYLLDWPIATDPRAGEILRDAVAGNKAEVGMQLHPWVSPPHDEEVNQQNSFAGNLPRDLERAKVFQLRDAIEENMGVAPLIYRAGRYGLGPNTADILREAGIAIDTSVRPHWDYSFESGRNYRNHPLEPYWVDEQRSLLELPLTTVFWGMLRKQGGAIYPRLWRMPQLRGLLSHLALLERIPLTPEGVTVDEAFRGIDMALDDGLPLMVLSFHSPSIHPGHTPYVRDQDDLDRFYDWWRRVFAYLEQREVKPTTVDQIMQAVKR